MTDADIVRLIDDLGHPRRIIQRRAAGALATAASSVALAPALLAALGDACTARRWGAAYTLALIGPPPLASLPILLEALGSTDGDRRWAAADIVTRLGSEAVADLLRLAAGGNAAQRKMALYCLRTLPGTGGDAERVVLAALSDPSVGVRLAGLTALPHVAHDRHAAAGAVLALVRDPDPGVCRAAISTLGALGERSPAIDAAIHHAAQNDGDAGLRRAAARATRMLGMV